MAKIEFKVGELVLVSNGFLFEYANVKSLAVDGSPELQFKNNNIVGGGCQVEHVPVNGYTLTDVGENKLPNGLNWGCFSPSFFMFDANQVGSQWPLFRYEDCRLERDIDLFNSDNLQSRLAAFDDFKQFLIESRYNKENCKFYIAEHHIRNYEQAGVDTGLIEAKSFLEDLIRSGHHDVLKQKLAKVERYLIQKQ